jgi:hypothetical protein
MWTSTIHAFTIHASIRYIRIKINVSLNPLVNNENQTYYTHFDAYHNKMCLVVDTQRNMFMASKKTSFLVGLNVWCLFTFKLQKKSYNKCNDLAQRARFEIEHNCPFPLSLYFFPSYVPIWSLIFWNCPYSCPCKCDKENGL